MAKPPPLLSTAFAQQVIAAVTSNCKQIPPGTVTNTQHLCGSSLWQTLSVGKRRQAGKIVRAGIEAGLLQLKPLKKPTNNHQLFELL